MEHIFYFPTVVEEGNQLLEDLGTLGGLEVELLVDFSLLVIVLFGILQDHTYQVFNIGFGFDFIQPLYPQLNDVSFHHQVEAPLRPR